MDNEAQGQLLGGLTTVTFKMRKVSEVIESFLARRTEQMWRLKETVMEMGDLRCTMIQGRDELGEAAAAFDIYLRHLTGQWPDASDKFLFDRDHYLSCCGN